MMARTARSRMRRPLIASSPPIPRGTIRSRKTMSERPVLDHRLPTSLNRGSTIVGDHWIVSGPTMQILIISVMASSSSMIRTQVRPVGRRGVRFSGRSCPIWILKMTEVPLPGWDDISIWRRCAVCWSPSGPCQPALQPQKVDRAEHDLASVRLPRILGYRLLNS